MNRGGKLFLKLTKKAEKQETFQYKCCEQNISQCKKLETHMLGLRSEAQK